MALPCNSISLIFPPTSSSSTSIADLKYFAKSNLLRSAPNPNQYRISAAASGSTSESSRPQEYHQLDRHGVFLQERILDDYEEKLEKVRKLVEWRDPMEGLMFVDAIQRLGVAHHFKKEIETVMEQHYLQMGNKTQSLRDVALSFRLLRQRGYHVSGDVFNNFKGEDGKFRDEVKQDIWGLVELYEATKLSFVGEDILEEAQDLRSQILHQHLAQDPKFKGSNIVQMRLRYPYIECYMRDEHQEGRDGSYIECYMRDNPESTFEQARDHVLDRIGMEWKRLNEECFNLSNPSSSALQFKEAALNMARMISLMYNYDKNQALPALEKYVQIMLPNLIQS